MTVEQDRLNADGAAWRAWGPYLSERAWGTVREDYSADGSAWDYFPHDHARSRAYRWNEDGLAGICDERQYLCLALALWNERDPILKERLFGLTGPQGNHGEDVKEYYFYLDATPTASYLKILYKYPQAEFPYERLITENARRTKADPEFELLDTGIFADNRYFDVQVEYCKLEANDLFMRIQVTNRGPAAAPLHLLPTLWFRNTWAWGRDDTKPSLQEADVASNSSYRTLAAQHTVLGAYYLYCHAPDELLFTENETNMQRLFGAPNASSHVKDAFHEYVVHGIRAAVNPARQGTKAAAHYSVGLDAGQSTTIYLRLTPRAPAALGGADPFEGLDTLFQKRISEADEFFASLLRTRHAAQPPSPAQKDLASVQRQALAGMVWNKQYYHYDVNDWLQGDPAQPKPPDSRLSGRNHEWITLDNMDILSMPDKWEYPWYASWDLAFHCLALALVDAEFAKNQLVLLGREWYQHPNGQIPAYEWAFGDANPPVYAWAAYRVYKIDQKQRGGNGDVAFLERVFHKLLLNFTWWVNRKDREGNNLFQGGFLGLDNIGVFDRSAPLPTGGYIEQSDGTSWMGMFSLNMMTIALELARRDPVYEDIAVKFFEHFLYIAGAMNNVGNRGISLWDEDDEFFYDVLHLPDGRHQSLKVRSLVGLIPLLAVETIEPQMLEQLPAFRERLEWFLGHQTDLAGLVSHWELPGQGSRRLIALVRGHRMKRLLARALDPDEFLGDFGVRSLSKYHQEHPFTLAVDSVDYTVRYEPAESRTGVFGGNSNWRGPIWFPINYLLIESLQKFYHYYSNDFLVECPTGSGKYLTLLQIADELSQRLIRLVARDPQERRPCFGGLEVMQSDPHWRDAMLFHEYFNGDDGAGLGASHQTGWTGLIAKLIQQQWERYSATSIQMGIGPQSKTPGQ